MVEKFPSLKTTQVDGKTPLELALELNYPEKVIDILTINDTFNQLRNPNPEIVERIRKRKLESENTTITTDDVVSVDEDDDDGDDDGDSQTAKKTRIECEICSQESRHVCGGCQNAYYCSENCQELDWHYGHSAVCGLENLQI